MAPQLNECRELLQHVLSLRPRSRTIRPKVSSPAVVVRNWKKVLLGFQFPPKLSPDELFEVLRKKKIKIILKSNSKKKRNFFKEKILSEKDFYFNFFCLPFRLTKNEKNSLFVCKKKIFP